MQQPPPTRRAITLLELIAVLTLMGIMSAVTIARYSTGSQFFAGAQADMRRLITDLQLARRRAISTGDNHLISFTTTGGVITGYEMQRRDVNGGLTTLANSHTFNDEITVAVTPGNPEFNFQGEGLAAYQISLATNGRTWLITVVPITGYVNGTEL